MVKDHIIKHGGLEGIAVTKNLIKMCEGAHEKYEKHLHEKQQLTLKEAAASKALEEAAVVDEKRKAEDETRRQVELDLDILRTGIGIAELLWKAIKS